MNISKEMEAPTTVDEGLNCNGQKPATSDDVFSDLLFGGVNAPTTLRGRFSKLVMQLRKGGRNFYYFVRGYIKPYNVVRIQFLDRGWNDRCETFLHAAFQVLVDFVEFEHTFAPWDVRDELTGRYQDIDTMRRFVEETYGPTARGLMTDANDRIHAERYHPVAVEILELYSWYKARKWEFDVEANMFNHHAQRAHDLACDVMLHRLVKCRRAFWS